MRKYIVKEITKQDTFTIVQLEPQNTPLLFEEEIQPGCIQHIISSISKYGKESEEQCNRMCKILCQVDLDDYSSRKQVKRRQTFATVFAADNKNTFRRYRGVVVLIEMLRTHKNVEIVKTLIHVLSRNGKQNL